MGWTTFLGSSIQAARYCVIYLMPPRFRPASILFWAHKPINLTIYQTVFSLRFDNKNAALILNVLLGRLCERSFSGLIWLRPYLQNKKTKSIDYLMGILLP